MLGQRRGLGLTGDMQEVIAFKKHPRDIRQRTGNRRVDRQEDMFMTGTMTGSHSLTDGTGLPVVVEVMQMEPWVTQDEQWLRRIQDVELDGLMVVTRQEHGNLGGLVSDCALSVAINSPSGNRMRQGNQPKPQ